MSADQADSVPVRRKDHRTDVVATKMADKAGSMHILPSKQKGPPGGFDDTPVPRAPPGYTVKITFHRAKNLPFADFNSFSSDPYLIAQINTKLPTRHKQDPKLRFRTPTIRRNTDPEWECEWIVANIPASGFQMKARLYDEDPADHDDRLGNVHVNVDCVSENWEGIHERGYGIKKRMGSKRAYFMRGAAALFHPDVHMSGELVVSVEVLERTNSENGGRVYTAGPCHWSRHHSPLFGMLVGTKDPESTGPDGKKKQERYNFTANQIQLQGPTPDQMYHRYVEFKPFVQGMFTATSVRGRILNRALHHQHARIYNYDRTTIYGVFDRPSEDLTRQFLDLAHWDKGGRTYTYVITLDGQMRFTETGKEFSIDLLSKHTMHADCDNWISYSGEFFIRRLKRPWTGEHKRSHSGVSGVSGISSASHAAASPSRSPKLNASSDPAGAENHAASASPPQTPNPSASALDPDQPSHPPDDIDGGPPSSSPPTDPRYYHLIIDNDSGTYRPNAQLLPLLAAFLGANLPGLKISTLDCQADAEKMGKMKAEQRERKKKEGEQRAFVQVDSSDEDSSGISSSDEEELEQRAGEGKGHGKVGRAMRKVGEPKAAVLEWAQGGEKRHQREGEERFREGEGVDGGGHEKHEEKKHEKHGGEGEEKVGRRERAKREEEGDQALLKPEHATEGSRGANGETRASNGREGGQTGAGSGALNEKASPQEPGRPPGEKGEFNGKTPLQEVGGPTEGNGEYDEKAPLEFIPVEQEPRENGAQSEETPLTADGGNENGHRAEMPA
ncbi:MAG: hypothetical protein MMC23_003644 [Stictis urceolatum]|nr:hypothetical protein [Stictis urceolata]